MSHTETYTAINPDASEDAWNRNIYYFGFDLTEDEDLITGYEQIIFESSDFRTSNNAFTVSIEVKSGGIDYSQLEELMSEADTIWEIDIGEIDERRGYTADISLVAGSTLGVLYLSQYDDFDIELFSSSNYLESGSEIYRTVEQTSEGGSRYYYYQSFQVYEEAREGAEWMIVYSISNEDYFTEATLRFTFQTEESEGLDYTEIIEIQESLGDLQVFADIREGFMVSTMSTEIGDEFGVFFFSSESGLVIAPRITGGITLNEQYSATDEDADDTWWARNVYYFGFEITEDVTGEENVLFGSSAFGSDLTVSIEVANDEQEELDYAEIMEIKESLGEQQIYAEITEFSSMSNPINGEVGDQFGVFLLSAELGLEIDYVLGEGITLTEQYTATDYDVDEDFWARNVYYFGFEITEYVTGSETVTFTSSALSSDVSITIEVQSNEEEIDDYDLLMSTYYELLESDLVHEVRLEEWTGQWQDLAFSQFDLAAQSGQEFGVLFISMYRNLEISVEYQSPYAINDVALDLSEDPVYGDEDGESYYYLRVFQVPEDVQMTSESAYVIFNINNPDVGEIQFELTLSQAGQIEEYGQIQEVLSGLHSYQEANVEQIDIDNFQLDVVANSGEEFGVHFISVYNNLEITAEFGSDFYLVQTAFADAVYSDENGEYYHYLRVFRVPEGVPSGSVLIFLIETPDVDTKEFNIIMAPEVSSRPIVGSEQEYDTASVEALLLELTDYQQVLVEEISTQFDDFSVIAEGGDQVGILFKSERSDLQFDIDVSEVRWVYLQDVQPSAVLADDGYYYYLRMFWVESDTEGGVYFRITGDEFSTTAWLWIDQEEDSNQMDYEELEQIMEEVSHLTWIDVEEISTRYNSHFVSAAAGDEFGVLFFSEHSDLEISIGMPDGSDLLTETTIVDAVEREVSWSTYPRYYYYRSYSVANIDQYEATLIFSADEFVSDVTITFEKEQTLIQSYDELLEVMGSLDFRQSFNMDALDDTEQSITISGEAGEQFGVLFYSARDNEHQIQPILHGDLLYQNEDAAQALREENYWYWFYSFGISRTSGSESQTLFFPISYNGQVWEPMITIEREQEETEEEEDSDTTRINAYSELNEQFREVDVSADFIIDSLDDSGKQITLEVVPGDSIGILFLSERDDEYTIEPQASEFVSATGVYAQALEAQGAWYWYWDFILDEEATQESEITFVIEKGSYSNQIVVYLEIQQEDSAEEEIQIITVDDAGYYETMDLFYELDHPVKIELDSMNDVGEIREVLAAAGETFGFVFQSQRNDEFEIRLSYRDDNGLLIDYGDRGQAMTNGDQWIWNYFFTVDQEASHPSNQFYESTMTFSISIGSYSNEVTIFFEREEIEQIEEPEEVEEEEIFDEYREVMETYYQLDRQVEIDLGEYVRGDYESTTIYAEAGETFGVLFFSTESEKGQFAQGRIYLRQEDELVVQRGDWLTQDEDKYYQVTAFEVIRTSESYESTITYEFVFETEAFEFQINFVRSIVTSTNYWITEVEELIDTYYGLDNGFYISLDWLQDTGETMHYYADDSKEFGFLFYSRRSDIEVEFAIADGTSLIYNSGTFASAVEMDDQFYWFRSFAVDEYSTNYESKVQFVFYFGRDYQIPYTVYVERGSYNNWGELEQEEESAEEVQENTISNMRGLEESVRELDHFWVISVDDLDSTDELELYAEIGQTYGLLYFSQNEDVQIDYAEDFEQDSQQLLYPSGDFAWELDEGQVFYWYSSYVVSRDATEGEASIQYTIEYNSDSDDDIDFNVRFKFVSQTPADQADEEWDWVEFEEEVIQQYETDEDLEDVLPAEWYENCFDTTNGAIDSAGDTCAWYEDHIDLCGRYDTSEFSSVKMCCVCSWANQADSDFVEEIYEDCENTNGEAVDSFRDDCAWYESFPKECGRYDNHDFDAVKMCCACASFVEDLHWAYDGDFEGAEYLEQYADDVVFADEEVEEEEEEAEPVNVFQKKVVPADEIDYEALEDFSEEEWKDFVAKDIDPFDPMMDWSNLGDLLTNFNTKQAEDAQAYQECIDTAGDLTDEWRNSCDMYSDYPTTCGAGDTEEFVASELCCACGGGSTAGQRVCEDTAGEAVDSDGFSCVWYENNPGDCGLFDDDDFLSQEMCCGCGGGKGDYFDPLTAEVESVGEILEQADNAGDVFMAVVHHPGVLLNVFGGGRSAEETAEA